MADMYKTIDDLLTKRGISGYKMCTDLGMSRSFMTELRKGRAKSLNMDTAGKIAEYFGVTMDYLLGKEGQKEKPTAQSGELDQQMEGIEFALYGEVKDMTDAQKRDVLKFAQFLKQKGD